MLPSLILNHNPCEGKGLANGTSFWPRSWKTHFEEASSWKYTSLISEHVHWEIIEVLEGLHFVKGCVEQSEAGGHICISLDIRQLKLEKSGIPQLICPENLHRVMTDLSARESFCSQRISSTAWSSWRTPDNTEINHSACWNVRLGKMSVGFSNLQDYNSKILHSAGVGWIYGCVYPHVGYPTGLILLWRT